ncbi:MAG: nitronate monooxygenase [Acidobacteriota bacterium]
MIHHSPLIDTPLTRALGIEVPLICGAMYPCSNAELVAAVSEAGGIGIVQPISLTYVYGHDFREGLRHIKKLTDKPIGMNVLTEKSSERYLERMRRWLDIAVEEGVRFFVSSLGDPRWIVDTVESVGGLVYHDVTERRWAQKAFDSGVHGLIAVNNRAGGHAGPKGPEVLLDELADLGLPVACAGGIGDETAFARALSMGYVGVQAGTRFIATTECASPDEYKRGVVEAGEEDIVLTHRLTAVPVAVINNDRVKREGTDVPWPARRLLANPRTKHWVRAFYSLKSVLGLKKAATGTMSHKDYFQAGKSVAGVTAIESAGEIVHRWAGAVKS